MKKLLLFIAGISILFLAGCYNGNQSHGNEGMGDSLPADPPLGYVNLLAELKNRLKISIFLWRKSCASR
jgi:archaemetzincin